ncbi:MAG: aldehyde dehydrogenase family protein [Polyangiaceae bacterium]|nr:aldehyde dehydrogenase family protein [Polyangiaceae bacterium]
MPISNAPPTSRAVLDQSLERLASKAREFARAPIAQKERWLSETRQAFKEVAPALVERACAAKRIDFSGNLAAEEWLSGPGIILRHLRQYEGSLARRRVSGRTLTSQSRVTETDEGRTTISVLPVDSFDRAVFLGFTSETWLASGVAPGDVAGLQGTFYDESEPEGGVSLVLGAGNIASIPAVDALYKLFVEGRVCLLKLNPINDYLGPCFERAFEVLIRAGFLQIAYGGGDVGAYLCQHPMVSDIHITGSDRTFDHIVWGPPGEERTRRQALHQPLLTKPITSELGNISPAIITPAKYTDAQLQLMARNVVGTFVLNAGFNCNATKLLVLARGWPQAPLFLKAVAEWLGRVPTRYSYYPGSEEAYGRLLAAGSNVQKFGEAREGTLPWALVSDVEPHPASPTFNEEPFCAVLSQTSLGSPDPEEFFQAATSFLNDHVRGTLNAMLLVPPQSERDPRYSQAVKKAISALRYGVIGVNHWPAAAFGMGSIPWGGYPGATLEDVQSGIGFVHNTFMLERIEKSVLRGPFEAFPLPMWFPGHRTQNIVAKKFCEFEAAPSWAKVAGLAWSALRA